LATAVESALEQTFQAAEVIVVNDGSDDDTDTVAKRYGDKITYVAQRNEGLSSARNAGVLASHGDYLLFLDSDDRLHPQGIEKLVSVSAPDRLVVGKFRRFTVRDGAEIDMGEGEPIEPFAVGLPDPVGLLIGNIAAPCAFLCPRRAAVEIGLFIGDRLAGIEDWDFWMRLAIHGLNVQRISDVVAFYRHHSLSMTSTNGHRMTEADIYLLQRNLQTLANLTNWLDDHGVSPIDIKKRILLKMRREYLSLAYSFRKSHSFVAASKAICRAASCRGPGGAELIEGMKVLVESLVFAVTLRPFRPIKPLP
jgi:glycosyltransferase involved in cell wall biosynthesis